MNSSVLLKLDQFDARALRAIARAPAHLTRETTSALRSRLCIDSPANALAKALRRRVQASQLSFAWFSEILRQLEEHIAVAQHTSQLVPVAVSEDVDEFGVACPECGQYFHHVRHMKSHQAKQHGHKGNAARQHPGVLPAEKYAAGSKGGMPTCTHCNKTFTRVEGLKKHVNFGCIATKSSKMREVVADADVPQGPQSTISLLQNSDFVHDLGLGWRRVLETPRYVQNLRDFCVFCGQWFEACKQHIRLMHPDAWSRKEVAEVRCRSSLLHACDPCKYCGKSVAQPRRHLTHCSVLFQASLAGLYVDAEVGNGGPGGGSG